MSIIIVTQCNIRVFRISPERASNLPPTPSV